MKERSGVKKVRVAKSSKNIEKPWKLVIYSLAMLASLVYMGYRVAFTLPLSLRPVDVIFGLIVFLVELLELFEFAVYFCDVLRVGKKSPKTPKIEDVEYPEVDVFVATLNEDEALLSRTLRACSRMEYPDKKKVHLYLCDDGNRDSLKALAKKYGAEHITRWNNYFAKSGNYNNALKHSESPFIAIFDADMRPKKKFLLKTIPFLVRDEKMGFVQTPQCFDNPDIFQSRFYSKMPFEQDYFYRYIQLARNNSNSVILCGTNCVLRRCALKEVGGFARLSIAEDVATGMMIESKGYKAIAIDKVLACGEAVSDYAGFLRQRSRWGRGCIQTGKNFGIFTMKGLSLRQKVDYFTAISYWFFGVRRLFYMILPLLFVYLGIIAIEGDLRVFIGIFLAQYILKRFVLDWVENGYKSSTWMKIFEMIQAPYMAFVVLKESIFVNRKFEVTRKGDAETKSKTGLIMGLVHLVLLAINIGGAILAIKKMQETGIELYLIPAIWIIVNSLFLLIALIFDLRRGHSYADFNNKECKRYGIKALLSIIWRERERKA